MPPIGIIACDAARARSEQPVAFSAGRAAPILGWIECREAAGACSETGAAVSTVVAESVMPIAPPEQRIGSPYSGRRLTLALLGYYLAVVAVITLVPFRFVVPQRLGFVSIANLPDFVANVLLFMPFGFLYRAARAGTGSRESWRALAAGALASLAVECVQLFEPERYPSHVDVLANALGAGIGALLCHGALRRIRAPDAFIGRLSLELPLMGLVYLLVPLLWVGSLSVGDSALRLWMLALPVLFGATLVGYVQRYHFGPAGAVSDRLMATVAAAGVLLGAFPALPRAPIAVLALAGGAALMVLRHARRAPGADRRFELPALYSALPFYGTYLLACALAPLTEPGGALGVGGDGGPSLRSIEILRLLHAAAAFTLLGYALAELRGRLELPFRAIVLRIVASSAPVAFATRIVGTLALGPAAEWAPGADLLWITITVGGALYGGWLYHLQRDHVRRLLAATGRDPAERSSPKSTRCLIGALATLPARSVPVARRPGRRGR